MIYAPGRWKSGIPIVGFGDKFDMYVNVLQTLHLYDSTKSGMEDKSQFGRSYMPNRCT